VPRGVNRLDEAQYQRRVWRPERGTSGGIWFGPNREQWTTDIDSSNIIVGSADFNFWSQNSLTVTTATAVGPDGTTVANTVATTGAAGEAICRYLNGGQTSGVWNVVSVFAKAKDTNICTIRQISGPDVRTYFNLGTGVVAERGSAAINAGMRFLGNGWWRCWTAVLPTNSGYLVDIGLSTAAGSPSVSGGESIYMWGAQQHPGRAPEPYKAVTNSFHTGTAPAPLIEKHAALEAWLGGAMGGVNAGLLYPDGPPLIGA
jgi:hypothetical protein